MKKTCLRKENYVIGIQLINVLANEQVFDVKVGVLERFLREKIKSMVFNISKFSQKLLMVLKTDLGQKSEKMQKIGLENLLDGN
ncbi:MAG: hypothetical protein CM15mP63_5640 [Gammaproteobacteria bacterium]|nr:MAG: hypothetical protein CM15mP63_5640 [Gammaproteobacteria bacterium]